MKRRILALFLALLIPIGLLPVRAEGNTGTYHFYASPEKDAPPLEGFVPYGETYDHDTDGYCLILKFESDEDADPISAYRTEEDGTISTIALPKPEAIPMCAGQFVPLGDNPGEGKSFTVTAKGGVLGENGISITVLGDNSSSGGGDNPQSGGNLYFQRFTRSIEGAFSSNGAIQSGGFGLTMRSSDILAFYTSDNENSLIYGDIMYTDENSCVTVERIEGTPYWNVSFNRIGKTKLVYVPAEGPELTLFVSCTPVKDETMLFWDTLMKTGTDYLKEDNIGIKPGSFESKVNRSTIFAFYQDNVDEHTLVTDEVISKNPDIVSLQKIEGSDYWLADFKRTGKAVLCHSASGRKMEIYVTESGDQPGYTQTNTITIDGTEWTIGFGSWNDNYTTFSLFNEGESFGSTWQPGDSADYVLMPAFPTVFAARWDENEQHYTADGAPTVTVESMRMENQSPAELFSFSKDSCVEEKNDGFTVLANDYGFVSEGGEDAREIPNSVALYSRGNEPGMAALRAEVKIEWGADHSARTVVSLGLRMADVPKMSDTWVHGTDGKTVDELNNWILAHCEEAAKLDGDEWGILVDLTITGEPIKGNISIPYFVDNQRSDERNENIKLQLWGKGDIEVHGGIQLNGATLFTVNGFRFVAPESETETETRAIFGGGCTGVNQCTFTGYDVALDASDGLVQCGWQNTLENNKIAWRVDLKNAILNNKQDCTENRFLNNGTAVEILSMNEVSKPYSMRITDTDFVGNNLDFKVPAPGEFYFYRDFFADKDGARREAMTMMGENTILHVYPARLESITGENDGLFLGEDNTILNDESANLLIGVSQLVGKKIVVVSDDGNGSTVLATWQF